MQPFRILVADDDEEVVEHITSVLLPVGYRVEKACDGREALAKLRTEAFDLLIVDMMMPRMDGIEMLQTLQTEPLPRRLPTIMLVPLSARAEDHEGFCDWLRPLGIDHFMIRSRLKQTDIVQVVQGLLSSRR